MLKVTGEQNQMMVCTKKALSDQMNVGRSFERECKRKFFQSHWHCPVRGKPKAHKGKGGATILPLPQGCHKQWQFPFVLLVIFFPTPMEPPKFCVVCDIDGVIWCGGKPIPGGDEAIRELESNNVRKCNSLIWLLGPCLVCDQQWRPFCRAQS